MEARKTNIVSALIIVAFSIIIGGSWLNENCNSLDNSCKGLVFFGGIMAVVTIFYIENSINGQKARGEWYEKKRELRTSYKSNSKRVWTISMGRVLLTALLLGLSAVIQGGFVMLFSGIFLGLGLDRLARGLTGNLPPPKSIDE